MFGGTTQEGNRVGGDQAARDVNKPTNIYNFGSTRSKSSAMQALLLRLKEEEKLNPNLTEFIEDLDYYNSSVDGEFIGLEKKLINGDQEALISYALRAKERYHKKLLKYQFSEAAQRINVHVLALIESYFINHIYSRICKGESSENINSLIQELIINPVMEYLEENPLDFNAQDINGMLYFLTGNCHIKWNK